MSPEQTTEYSDQDKKAVVTEVVRAELQDLMKTSFELREKVNSAKTQVKKDYYQKKLIKNNQLAMGMLFAAERLNTNDAK